MRNLTIFHSKSQQVTQYLEKEIRSGRLKQGEKLQPTRELANFFQVSTIVINSAYDELERKGLIERRARCGVFIGAPTRTPRFLIVDYAAAHLQESSIPQIIQEFEKICYSSQIVLENLQADFLRSGNISELTEKLHAQEYSGALLLGSTYRGDEPEIKILQALKIPVIIVHADQRDAERTGFATIRPDSGKAWYDALHHLHKQGFRKIGALLNINHDGDIRFRTQNLEEHYGMMNELGLEILPDSILALPYEDEKYFIEKLKSWLGGSPKFDAVICFSDFWALRLYKYCQLFNIRIPKDLAVMGFCNYPGGHLLTPPLSTIDLNLAESGKKAAEILTGNPTCFSDLPQEKRTFIIKHRLVARGSTIKYK